MFIDQFIGLGSSLSHHGICLGPCLIQDRILITDNLLIFFDLIRNAETKLYQQFFQFFLVYQNFGIGKRLELTAVNVFFNLTN